MIFVNDRYITIPDDDVFVTLNEKVLFKVNSNDDTRTYTLFINQGNKVVVAIELAKQIHSDHTILEWIVLPEHVNESNVVSIQLKTICGNSESWFTHNDYLIVKEKEDISDFINTDYQCGYEDGYNKGHEQGKVDGYNDGRNSYEIWQGGNY